MHMRGMLTGCLRGELPTYLSCAILILPQLSTIFTLFESPLSLLT